MADEKTKKMYICPHCEKAFPSISALNGHTGGCKARADESDDQEDARGEQEDMSKEDGGITIFEDDEDELKVESKRSVDSGKDGEDGFGCGACGHTQKRKFKFCPECGVENDFE